MNNICENCGNTIRISIFKWGDWCSENCRKALVAREAIQRSRQKCTYEDRQAGPRFVDGYIEVCVVHDSISKYPESRGEHRPCLAVEGY